MYRPIHMNLCGSLYFRAVLGVVQVVSPLRHIIKVQTYLYILGMRDRRCRPNQVKYWAIRTCQDSGDSSWEPFMFGNGKTMRLEKGPLFSTAVKGLSTIDGMRTTRDVVIKVLPSRVTASQVFVIERHCFSLKVDGVT